MTTQGPMDPSTLIRLGPSPASAMTLENLPSEGTVPVILAVRRPGYVPEGVQVRVWLGDRMLTADVPVQSMAAVHNDPEVERLSLSEQLPLIAPV